MMFDAWILAVFVAYFVVLAGIAATRARHLRGMGDYALGGRRMGSFTSALSASSSGTSGWAILVFPALAFQHGLVEAWTAAMLVLGIWCSWTVLAKRLRRYTIAADDALTVPEFLGRRFAERGAAVRIAAAVITLFFILFYISSGLIAGAKLLQTTFGTSTVAGVFITLAAIGAYTFVGGFLAVSRTDAFQATLMLAALVIVPLWLIAVTQNPFAGAGAQTPGFWNPFTDRQDEPITAVFLLSAVGWGLGYLGSQRVVQRFMAVASEAKVPRSRDIGAAWMFLTYLFALLLGLVALPAFAEIGALEEALEDPERIFLLAAQAFFHPIVAGLLLSAVIAAVMSTADSQLLLASTIAANDLPGVRRFAQSLDAGGRLRLGRALLVFIGALAAGLAIFNPEPVLTLVSYAWGGMAAAFAPVTVMALHWRRFNAAGALAAMIAGTAAASAWGLAAGGPGGIMDIQPGAPGCLIATVAGVLATLLGAKPSAAATKLFDEVNSPAGAATPP